MVAFPLHISQTFSPCQSYKSPYCQRKGKLTEEGRPLLIVNPFYKQLKEVSHKLTCLYTFWDLEELNSPLLELSVTTVQWQNSSISVKCCNFTGCTFTDEWGPLGRTEASDGILHRCLISEGSEEQSLLFISKCWCSGLTLKICSWHHKVLKCLKVSDTKQCSSE